MPEYRLLTDGTLEIAARGTWRLIPGCSCAGIFEYGDRMAELSDLLTAAADDEATVATLYQGDRRFRWLVERVLSLNGCEPEWVNPTDLGWLLFGWRAEDGTPQQSPLALLNTPPPPRHPRKPSKGDGPNDFISLLAAIASQPDTSFEEALRIATSAPARLALGVLDDRAWASMTDEQRDEVQFKAWAGVQAKAMGGGDVGGWAKG